MMIECCQFPVNDLSLNKIDFSTQLKVFVSNRLSWVQLKLEIKYCLDVEENAHYMIETRKQFKYTIFSLICCYMYTRTPS